MGRKSPLGIEGTALSFRDPDDQGRPRTAQARAKDEAGAWQVRRFPVVSWKRDGTPLVPEDAIAWARDTRRSFVREEATARVASFQDFADVLVENLRAAGVGDERLALIKAVSAGLSKANITDMRTEIFAARVRTWITGLKSGWSFKPDAKNRPKRPGPLSAATRNKILIICRQVTQLAVRRRRLAFDPLVELPHFKEATTIKPVFSIAELSAMVSDEARDHVAMARTDLEAEIVAIGGLRMAAIRAIAEQRGCHWTSIYNALKRPTGPDPWWLAACVLVYTGCRADEAMHLRWEWISWDAGVITLKLADDYENKSDAERLIPLEPELRAILLPLAKQAGHIIAPEIRAGGSGMRNVKEVSDGKGAKDYTAALRKYLQRIGLDAKDRTAHSIRHSYISMKLARADQNTERLRKAVGHADFATTMGYGRFSQLYESEVDRWPDSTLWLRRSVAISAKAVKE